MLIVLLKWAGSVKMICPVHSFNVSLEEAKQIQFELRKRVTLSDAISDFDKIRYVGGADVAFIETVSNFPRTQNTVNEFHVNSSFRNKSFIEHTVQKKEVTALAGVVIMDIKKGCVVETVCATAPVLYPYIPGFLSFREGPAVLAALGKLYSFPEKR